MAVTSASFLSFAAPSIPSWLATSLSFGSDIAASSGLLERIGSLSVMYFFHLGLWPYE
jgi:hypothetical protein